jgi:hypothetical protein
MRSTSPAQEMVAAIDQVLEARGTRVDVAEIKDGKILTGYQPDAVNPSAFDVDDQVALERDNAYKALVKALAPWRENYTRIRLDTRGSRRLQMNVAVELTPEALAETPQEDLPYDAVAAWMEAERAFNAQLPRLEGAFGRKLDAALFAALLTLEEAMWAEVRSVSRRLSQDQMLSIEPFVKSRTQDALRAYVMKRVPPGTR